MYQIHSFDSKAAREKTKALRQKKRKIEFVHFDLNTSETFEIIFPLRKLIESRPEVALV